VPSQRGLDRIVTFADAVVAIAITLLVLPLVDLAGQAGAVPVARLVSDHLGQLGAFALSFVVIARLWTAHHRVFEGVGSYDAMIVRLTLLWLFTVVFLPFPTALLAIRADHAASVLYVGTLLASSVVLASTSAWVSAHPELVRADADSRRDGPPAWTTPGLLAVAFAVTVLVPAANVWPLLLLLATGPLDAVRRRRRAAAGRA
jgi:uncharacterized membrane protein